jgi:hypothetical protein
MGNLLRLPALRFNKFVCVSEVCFCHFVLKQSNQNSRLSIKCAIEKLNEAKQKNLPVSFENVD